MVKRKSSNKRRGGKKTAKRRSARKCGGTKRKMYRKTRGGFMCYDRYGEIDSHNGYYEKDGKTRAPGCPNPRPVDDDLDYGERRQQYYND